MQVKDIISLLESVAPPAYQESYDNSGLIVGDASAAISGVLISLDCTEEVVQEAIDKGCNMIVSHHPIVFKGLKRLNGRNYVERTVIKAIKNDIALYAIHTNLDHMMHGVNAKIADRLGLVDCKILQPKKEVLTQLVTYVPTANAEALKTALFEAGAGQIGAYSECSFAVKGEGTFKAGSTANPHVGAIGERHHEQEERIEMVFPSFLLGKVENALLTAHPYEEVAYSFIALKNTYKEVGAGMYGYLAEPMTEIDFLQFLKKKMKADGIRYTPLRGKKVHKVALCGGSGSFLLQQAKGVGADVYVTGDFKYHEFFDAEGSIVIADIGHYESEQFTNELLFEILKKKSVKFAVCLSEVNTNPINYL